MYWRNPEQLVFQGLSPLCAAAAPPRTDPRNIYHRSYEVLRAGLVDSDVPPPKPTETYFAPTTQKMRTSPTTGRPFKKPRITIVPGAAPGTIAFVDFHPFSDTGLYIDYVRVRSDLGNQGIGYRLMKAFYESAIAQGAQSIHWGRVMNAKAWRLLERMQTEFPGVNSQGHRYF